MLSNSPFYTTFLAKVVFVAGPLDLKWYPVNDTKVRFFYEAVSESRLTNNYDQAKNIVCGDEYIVSIFNL